MANVEWTCNYEITTERRSHNTSRASFKKQFCTQFPREKELIMRSFFYKMARLSGYKECLHHDR